MIKKNGKEYKVGYPILNNGKKFYPVFEIRYEHSLEENKFYSSMDIYYHQRKLKSGKWLVFIEKSSGVPCEYFEIKEEAEKYCAENYSVIEEDVGEVMPEEQLESNKNVEKIKKEKWWK